MSKEEFEKIKNLNLTKCICGYYNQWYNAQRYGTCTKCKKKIYKKEKFRDEMLKKLNDHN